MENENDFNYENKSNENISTKKSSWIRDFSLVFLVVLFIFILIWIITSITSGNKKDQFSLTYVNITTHNEYAYLNIDVETTNNITLYASDFSILTNNIPKNVEGIVTYSEAVLTPDNFSINYSIGPSIDINNNQTILISLNIKTEDLNNQRYFYKGQELIFGQKIFIKEK